MKRFFRLMPLALLLMTTGCLSSLDNSNNEHKQNSHLLSVKIKVIEVVEDSDNQFVVEALENCAEIIKQGDIILVTADSADISSILESYQENNSFRIYFPMTNDTSDGISVTCFDIIQYDSANKIVNQIQ